MTNEAGHLKEFDFNIISDSVCALCTVHLLETFCPAGRLNLKFGTRRREVKLYGLENDGQGSVSF